MVTRGFIGKKIQGPEDPTIRVPPGQHLVENFPVLTAGPTPRVAHESWTFSLKIGPRVVKKWNWKEFNDLPMTKVVRDIHCVTSWSKLDTRWEGVMVDEILADAGIEPPTEYMLAHTFDGYSTNVPVADLVGGKSMVALKFDGQPLETDHGGPARLLVPHLYFWKSAKWVNGLQFTNRDEAGFWELRGYHIYGDPWLEQRYTND
ncbi:MAG: sulfite oxidase-like oxidoreductase [Devosia sp.]